MQASTFKTKCKTHNEGNKKKQQQNVERIPARKKKTELNVGPSIPRSHLHFLQLSFREVSHLPITPQEKVFLKHSAK